jgi:hypothetical protein
MRRLEDGPDLRSGDRAAAAVGGQHHSLERLLADAVGRQARISEHGAGGVPRLTEVDLDRPAENKLHEVAEITGNRPRGQVVALALDDVGGELRRRLKGSIFREKHRIPYENTADLRIISRAYGRPAVIGNAPSHLLQAIDAVSGSVPLPGLGNAKRGKAVEEASADHTVVWVVSLEEERLAHGDGVEFTPAAWPPEVHHGNLGSGRKEVIPLVVRHADVTPHNCIVHPWRRPRAHCARLCDEIALSDHQPFKQRLATIAHGWARRTPPPSR